MGKTVSFDRPDGGKVQAYLAEPTSNVKDAPGVVVLQEWWGLNDQIRGVADRYAHAGYVALVPDLYRGKSTVEAAEAEHLMNNLNFADAAGQDVRGAVQYLKKCCPKVGVSGYCMGGALTLLSSVLVPDADAFAIYYGYPPIEFIDTTKITAPLLGHYGIDDKAFPIATVDQIEAKLREANVDFEFHRYKAQHAFANETAVGENRLPITEYNADAAQLAWTRTMGFFERHLR